VKRLNHASLAVGTALGALAVIAVTVIAFQTNSSARPSARPMAGRLTRFDRLNVSFRYPSDWTVRTDPADDGSFSTLIGFLSNQPLHKPCATRRQRGRLVEVSCGSPIDRLDPASILVSVWTNGAVSPTWSFKRLKGKPFTVGGRPAKLTVTHFGCSIGADIKMDLVVQRTVPGNYYEFSACIDGPHQQALGHQFAALINTVELTGA
jgi:hypothetical protein